MFQTNRFRGIKVDDQLELARLHDRHVARLLAAENAGDIDAAGILDARSVAYQHAVHPRSGTLRVVQLRRSNEVPKEM